MRKVLLALSFAVASYCSFAQSTDNYTFTTSTTGSLALDANGNAIDMSTGATQVLATSSNRDQSVNATAITFPDSFDFYIAGNRFTSFFASANGLVQLGSSATIAGFTYTIAGGTTAAPIFTALGGDLAIGTSGGIFGKLIGTAPNRCYVIEFRNMNLMWNTYTNDGTYQIRFYENTGVVEYVYGDMYCSTTGSANDATPEVGFSWGATANQSFSINIGTSAVDRTGSILQNTVTAGTNITNLHSTADGSRNVYTFTPAVVAAPSGLNATTVTGTSISMSWTDNSASELGFAIYRSTDNVNFSYVATLAADATTYTATGLVFGTTYYWKVYSKSEGGLSASNTLTQPTNTKILSGIKTIGTDGDYSNLTTAFAAINSLGLSGDIELQLIAGYPASPETYPIATSNELAAGSYHVKVYPTVSGLAITSANTTGTLNLDNAFNITFDGRVNQTGAKDLVIANTNIGASYAVQFINDARNNTLNYIIIQSTNNTFNSGTIVIRTTTNPNGNDNNTIDNCDIKDGAVSPVNAIYAVGTTTTPAQYNDNITISNNNIYNYFSAAAASGGIYAGPGNNAWTITNNKLYQTAPRTYTSGSIHFGMQVSHSNGNNFTISGNTIGFGSNTGTGVYTLAGNVSTRYIGINVSVGTTTASSIQGNTISGFSLNTTNASSTGSGVFAGINITNGSVNVGNTTPNIIGATTGTGAITATTSASGSLIVGITSSSAGIVNISNNLIGSITINGSATTVSGSVTGIQVSFGTPTVNGNTIGSTTTVNSINSPTVATGGLQFIRGIDVTSGVVSTTSIQSNTIANLNQNGTTTGANIRGISYSGTGLATISLNTVYNLSGSNANTAVSGGATGVQGILHTGTAPTGAVINNNTIYSIAATNTGAVQTNVVGIGYSNSTTGSITNNTIYDLRNASTKATATATQTVSGILIRALATSLQVSNNMISLGDAQTTNTPFIGIWNSFSTIGTINVYHNSVSISGTAASGTLPSFGLLRGDNSGTAVTSPVDIRNNIFSNTRSGGTGKHYAIGNQATVASVTGWGTNAANYNLLNAANPATVGLWGSADQTFAAWCTASAGDGRSFSGLPLVFENIPTGNLHLNMGTTVTPIESNGAMIAAVTTDIDNQPRPGPSGSVNGGAIAPDLGADEFDGVPDLLTLPVTITSFKASRKNTGVQVEWHTVNEINMAAYEVEKSVDALTFVKVGTIRPTGVSGYNWYDANPINGNNFYRIKQVDRDGAYKFTQAINVKIGGIRSIFTIAGNPIRNKTVTLQMENVERGNYTVAVFNSLGLAIATKAINHAGGSASETISLGNAAAGVYQLTITGNNAKETKTIIVE